MLHQMRISGMVFSLKHLQDWKLNVRKWSCLEEVCRTLAALADCCGASDYCAKYQQDLGKLPPANTTNALPWTRHLQGRALHQNEFVLRDLSSKRFSPLFSLMEVRITSI